VTGGDAGPTATANAAVEIYDPVTGLWSLGTSMSAARTYHTATLLPDGNVLVAGGRDNGGLQSAEVYDPGTSSWTTVGSMSGAHLVHTATLLSDGTVLVAGGTSNGSTYLATAERYNPVTASWAPAASMTSSRLGHTATRLPDGSVLVAGGQSISGGPILATSELFHPAKKGEGRWVSAREMALARTLHSASLLTTGLVIVCGGAATTGRTASCEVFGLR
jgi:N-acetylneuraminic acid mutarotase